MKINDDHLYHGAALTQIAEHPSFKAINAFSQNGNRSRSAFLINTDIGVFLKYASEPKGVFDEFIFTFRREHLEELNILKEKTTRVFIGLVCISKRHICCLPFDTFQSMLEERKRKKGSVEETYTILITLESGKSFRAYMNIPGRKKVKMGEKVVPRDAFPSCVFSEH